MPPVGPAFGSKATDEAKAAVNRRPSVDKGVVDDDTNIIVAVKTERILRVIVLTLVVLTMVYFYAAVETRT